MEFNAGQDQYLNLSFKGIEAGSYEDEQVNMEWKDQELGGVGYAFYCPNSTKGCGFTEFNVLEYGDSQGKWIKGTFIGELWMQTITPPIGSYKAVSGTFQVRRNF